MKVESPLRLATLTARAARATSGEFDASHWTPEPGGAIFTLPCRSTWVTPGTRAMAARALSSARPVMTAIWSKTLVTSRPAARSAWAVRATSSSPVPLTETVSSMSLATGLA
jgi:hypothetical protein